MRRFAGAKRRPIMKAPRMAREGGSLRFRSGAMPHRGRHLARAGPRTGVAEPARRQRKSPSLPCRGPALLTRPRRRILDRWPPEDATLAAYLAELHDQRRATSTASTAVAAAWPTSPATQRNAPRARLGDRRGRIGGGGLGRPGRPRRDPRAAVAGSAMAAAPSTPAWLTSPSQDHYSPAP